MAGSSGKVCIACDQGCAELFRKDNIGSIVRRQVVTMLPDLRQKYEMWIARDPQGQQVMKSFVAAPH